MARKQLTIKGGQGINRDQLPKELAAGVWSDCQNMRFRNGNDERVGGIALAWTPSNALYHIATFDVGAASGAGVTRFVVGMGLTKAYCWDGTTATEITRGLNGLISSMSGSGTAVTVTTSASHGLTTGDNVIIGGVTPTAYNTGSGGTSITVLSATTFSYVNTSTAAVTTQGYWDSNRVSNFTASAGEEFTSAVLNGIFYVNSLTDGCYYWSGLTSSDAQGRLRRLRVGGSQAGYAVFGRSIAAYKDYLFVMGFLGAVSAATSSGIPRKPYDIWWGSAAQPGSVPSTFLAAASNDAGDVQKPKGQVVHAKQFGETLYIYQEKGIIAVDWIGGNNVFSFRTLEGDDGILAPNCIANTPAGQFFLSQNLDLKVHTGGEAKSVSEGRMLNWIRANVNSTYYARSFLIPHRWRSEVLVCIPTSVSTASKALLYNYQDDTWGDRDLSVVTCGVAGMLPTNVATNERVLLATTTPQVGLMDSGTTDYGSSITSMVERTGIDLDDPSTVKTLQGTRWQDDGTAGATASVYHGSAMTADATPTYASAATYTLGTSDWVNTIANGGRYLAIKRSTTAEVGKCRSVDVDYTTGGVF